MEKKTPHCKLSRVHELVRAGMVRRTQSATIGGVSMGIVTMAEMCEVVLALKPSDFYKSMTTFADHTVWQDVYRPATPWGDVYLKLTVVHDVLIVSFKEL